MDATVFIPREYHAGLRLIGRHDWVTVLPPKDDVPAHGFKLDTDLLAKVIQQMPEEEGWEFSNFIARASQKTPFAIEAVAKLLGDGPKVFRPSLDQCEAMENVAIDLKVEEYAQPYPSIVIEFPEAFAKPRDLPRYILCRHIAEQKFVAMVAGKLVGGPNNFFDYVGMGGGYDETMETIICREVGVNEANKPFVSNIAWRVALNCNLALTHYETRLSRLNADKFSHLRSLAKATNQEKAHRARNLLIGEFQLIEFEQSIKFHEEQSDPHGASQAGSGGHRKPHWRRGHWRRQAVGVGRTERRLIFIKPMLIRRDLFAGDIANTSVTYRG